VRPPLRVRETRHPILYEIDARSWLARLSRRHGRPIRLADLTPDDLEPVFETGADLVWLMGVWRTGPAGRRFWREDTGLREQAASILPDVSSADIAGSPYAVAAYEVAPNLGGDEGLAVFRARLADAGVGLILDFVPNHTATDHPWVHRHPEWYVRGSDSLVAADPEGWFTVRAGGHGLRLAHGRDPYFPAWRDTAQLDYRVPALRTAMADMLLQVASRCDGVRCDMAMLVLEDIFCTTWQGRSTAPATGDAPAGEFWWHAIRGLRERYPDALMIGEAYWGLEYRLQQLGFDYTYDKVLLDRLRAGPGEEVAGHLRADLDFQRHSVRFLENHDEPRAAAVLPSARLRAAALVVATVPGMLLLHDGQLDGARMRTPVELVRRPDEPIDTELRRFYDRLLGTLSADTFRRGSPVHLEPLPTWGGDATNRAFVAWLWVGPRRSLRLAVANLGGSTGRCFVPLNLPDFAGRAIEFEDQLSDARYVRDGDDLLARGLYLEMPPAGFHLFRIRGHAPRNAEQHADPR